MADITMCAGTGCTKTARCYRFTAVPNPWRQSYFMVMPLLEDGKCKHFSPNSPPDDGDNEGFGL